MVAEPSRLLLQGTRKEPLKNIFAGGPASGSNTYYFVFFQRSEFYTSLDLVGMKGQKLISVV